MSHTVECMDVIKWAEQYKGEPFHALLCDPPYELGFMGKDWDRSGIAFDPDTWVALAEHLHPGAFGMAFASSRGWHRLAVAIEDAGLRIHPSIFGWAYGSGFPKATRIKNAPEFEGHRYGLQALKPALEPIIVFQKPYPKGKKTWESIVETGAGALNIDQARIGTGDNLGRAPSLASKDSPISLQASPDGAGSVDESWKGGRWPANLCLIHHEQCVRVGEKRVESKSKATAGGRRRGGGTYGKYAGYEEPPEIGYADSDGLETISDWRCVPECPVRRLGEQSGERDGATSNSNGLTAWFGGKPSETKAGFADSGTAARFFHQSDWSYEIAERLATSDPVMYCAKAARAEREEGLIGQVPCVVCGELDSETHVDLNYRESKCRRCGHPTVKPISLAKWLSQLLLPPAEYAPRRLLIPFLGSGSEAIGAGLVGWEYVLGIEMNPETCEIAEARLKHWLDQPKQGRLF